MQKKNIATGVYYRYLLTFADFSQFIHCAPTHDSFSDNTWKRKEPNNFIRNFASVLLKEEKKEMRKPIHEDIVLLSSSDFCRTLRTPFCFQKFALRNMKLPDAAFDRKLVLAWPSLARVATDDKIRKPGKVF